MRTLTMQLSDRTIGPDGLEPSRREIAMSLREHGYEQAQEDLVHVRPSNYAAILVAGIIGGWTAVLFILWALAQAWDILYRRF